MDFPMYFCHPGLQCYVKLTSPKDGRMIYVYEGQRIDPTDRGSNLPIERYCLQSVEPELASTLLQDPGPYAATTEHAWRWASDYLREKLGIKMAKA